MVSVLPGRHIAQRSRDGIQVALSSTDEFVITMELVYAALLGSRRCNSSLRPACRRALGVMAGAADSEDHQVAKPDAGDLRARSRPLVRKTRGQ